MQRFLPQIVSKFSSFKHKSLVYYLIVILFLVISGIVIHSKIINDPPKGKHRWSQSDHYAIALGYKDNNLNLFKPQTYLLNPPIVTPKVDKLEGITRVDFPLFHYIVGAFMKITSNDSPLIHRLIALIISLIGLFFLFKLVLTQTKSFWSALIVVLFIFCLPVYLYYQCNFLPSVPGISLCFIGYYFYFKYLSDKGKLKYFILSILFLWMAVLFRLPIAISLIAVVCQQTLYYFLKKKINWSEIAVFLSAILLIGAYYCYNIYLENTYGSIFLNRILPPSSVLDLKEKLNVIYEHQFHHLSTKNVRIFVVILILNMITYFIYAIIKRQKLTSFQKQLILQVIITFVGGMMYFILMIEQYIYHDYYFIDTFFVSFILLIVLCISFINWKYRWINIIVKTFLFLLLFFSVSKADKQQKEWQKFTPSEDDFYVDKNIEDIQLLMERHGITKHDLIYIMDDKMQLQANIPFCILKQKGFCWSGSSDNRKWISKSDYIFTTKKSLINSLFRYDFALKYELEVLDEYGTIVMLKETGSIETDTINMERSDNSSIIYKLNFDERPSLWWGIQDSVVRIDNENNVAYAFPHREYLSGFSIPLSELGLKNNALSLHVEFDFFPLQEEASVTIVSHIERNGESYAYNNVNLKGGNNGAWIKMQYLFYFGELNINTDKIGIYLWNSEKSEFYYDNLSVQFSQ